MPQYLKLRKKAQAGARFVINQIGWDVRKDDELLRWIRRDGLPLRALANVYLLSRAAARVFRKGRIPGVVVTDELLELAERHGASPDKGRAFFVDLAAKHVAVARGLGFDGVYLGGHMPAATFGEILDRGRLLRRRRLAASSRARSGSRLEDEFHFFEPDPETGLSSDRVNEAYLESKRRRRTDLRVPLKYRFSRRLHGAVFADEAPLFPAGRPFYRARREGSAAGRQARARGSSRRRRCRCSAAATAATARSPRSPTSAPSRSARRTSATARAAAPATASARSTTPSASGRRPTSGSRPTARRSRCSTARS